MLNKIVKVKFVDDIIGKKAVKEINNLKEGEVLLLENIRNLNDEMNPSANNLIVKTLAPLFDIFINDAFSVSHRMQTSVVSFPRFLDSGIGRTMQRELESLEKLRVKGALFILGGAKPEEDMLLLKKKRKILATGAFALLCLIVRNYDLGAQGKKLKKEFKEFRKLRALSKNVTMPVDFAFNINGKRKDFSLENFSADYEALDIGDETIKLFIREIKKAHVILMKGPPGKFEDKRFAKGTRELLRAIANSKAFSVLGGGHTSSALEKFHINKNRFDYVSLAGGAFLTYLAGEKLPGLEVLERWKK